jgi:hypothetical protein
MGESILLVLLSWSEGFKKAKGCRKKRGAGGAPQVEAAEDRGAQLDAHEEAMKQWILTEGCQRDVADAYFGNPVHTRK